MKDKNHYLNRYRKSIWQNTKSFHIKTLNKLSTEGIYDNIIKVIYDKSIANIKFNGKRLKAFPLRIRNKTRMPTLTSHTQHSTGSPGQSNQARKRSKKHLNHKGRSKTVCLQMTWFYIQKTLNTTKKMLKLINEFNKVAEQKINIQKSVSSLNTNNELSEKEIMKTTPFTIA